MLILFDSLVAIEELLSTGDPFPKLPVLSKIVKVIVVPSIITPVTSPSIAGPGALEIFILSTWAMLNTPPVIATSGTVIAALVLPKHETVPEDVADNKVLDTVNAVASIVMSGATSIVPEITGSGLQSLLTGDTV